MNINIRANPVGAAAVVELYEGKYGCNQGDYGDNPSAFNHGVAKTYFFNALVQKPRDLYSRQLDLRYCTNVPHQRD